METNDQNQTAQNAPAQDGDQKPQNAVEKRINALFAQKRAAEERAELADARSDELQAELLQLREKVGLLEQATSQSGHYNQPATTPQPGQDVVQVIDEKFKQLEERWSRAAQQQQAQQQLHSAQMQSFDRAKLEFPELSDVNSDFHQTANRLFSSNPALRASPDGPAQAALMAAGLLAGPGSGGTPSGERKAAAAGGPATGPAGSTPAANQVQELEKQLAQVIDDQRNQRGDPGKLHGQARVLKMKLAQAKGENIGPVFEMPGS
jgi:hypothetical protein